MTGNPRLPFFTVRSMEISVRITSQAINSNFPVLAVNLHI